MAVVFATLGMVAATTGCRNQCHNLKLFEISVPGQRDCACCTTHPAPAHQHPATTPIPAPATPAPATPAPVTPVPAELAPAAGSPAEPRPHSILAARTGEPSPATCQFTAPGTPSVVSRPVQPKARTAAAESSSRRVNAYTTGTNSGTGIAGTVRPDNTTAIAEPDLIVQLPVLPAVSKPDDAAEQLAELDAEILEATEPLATPPVIDELHGPLPQPTHTPAEVTKSTPAEKAAEEATRIAAGIANTAAASATELQIAAVPLASSETTGSDPFVGPVVLRAIAPDTIIRPISTPAIGSRLHAIPVGFQRPVPAAQPSTPAGFPFPGTAQPLGPTLIPQPVFRDLPFHEPAAQILRATASQGEAPASQSFLPHPATTAPVVNTATIVGGAAGSATQR